VGGQFMARSSIVMFLGNIWGVVFSAVSKFVAEVSVIKRMHVSISAARYSILFLPVVSWLRHTKDSADHSELNCETRWLLLLL